MSFGPKIPKPAALTFQSLHISYIMIIDIIMRMNSIFNRSRQVQRPLQLLILDLAWP